MLTKANSNWAGFAVKGGRAQQAAQSQQQEVPKAVNNINDSKKIIELLDDMKKNIIPLEARLISNGVNNIPFDNKKKLVYLGYVELYLEAQLAEVRKLKQELQEESLK